MTRCLCFLPVDEWVDISKSQRLSQCLLCTLAIGPNQYAWSHLHPEMENPCGGWWISLVCTDPLTSRLLHEREREKEGKKGGTGERESGGEREIDLHFCFLSHGIFESLFMAALVLPLLKTPCTYDISIGSAIHQSVITVTKHMFTYNFEKMVPYRWCTKYHWCVTEDWRVLTPQLSHV